MPLLAIVLYQHVPGHGQQPGGGSRFRSLLTQEVSFLWDLIPSYFCAFTDRYLLFIFL